MGYDPGDCEIVDTIMFDVWGHPGPQGSKKGYIVRGGRRKGKVAMVEVSKKVKPWRKRIEQAAQIAAVQKLWVKHEEGPVKVLIQFFMPYPQRPKWKRDGRPDRMPDIDKLGRSTLDGLSDSGVIFGDDRQVVDLHQIEHYADEDHQVGARIHIVSLRECAKPARKKSEKGLVLCDGMPDSQAITAG